ncbi:MAG: 5'/3'-nucleotidase SurE [Chloroflexi bacterium]|nr:5'/3'-nucleotidase SurE [Chloroflexota bacterium]
MLSNDDGIESPGLHALVRAVHSLGELLVVAPRHQQSATSRSYAQAPGATETHTLRAGAKTITAWAIEATPAQAVMHGLLRFAARPPDLLISGINYGENIGAGLTVSGTVGAAWEGASMGIPALAVSLEVGVEHHYSHSDAVDFVVASRIARRFAKAVLQNGMPDGVQIYNINVPENAPHNVPWRLTRVSRHSHYYNVVREDQQGEKVVEGYDRRIDLTQMEEGSDLYALFKERKVSVTPLTIDVTAQTPADEIMRRLTPL